MAAQAVRVATPRVSRKTVTFDVRASGIVAGDYNKGYATSDGLVMDLQALKELAAKVDPAAAKKCHRL